jgi:hypothetical protein
VGIFKVINEKMQVVYNSYWGETESFGTAATTGLLYQPQIIGDGDCGEIVE